MKLNPTGRIPTLAHNDSIIFESAAICLYLCEQHPESNLLPAVGSFERAEFFQWLFFLTGSIQAELMPYFYPARHTTDPSMAESISVAQEQRVTEMFALIDRQLSQRDFLVGDQLTICDFFLFMLAHWASNFKTPPLSFNHLGRYLRALAKRPSVQSACATEGTRLEIYQDVD